MIDRLTSRQNKWIKLLQKGRRNKDAWSSHCFPEGFRLCEEVLKSGLEIEACFVDENLDDELVSEYVNRANMSFKLDSELFSYISSTTTPQGILLVVKNPEHGGIDYLFDRLRGENASLLILENLQDPGNLGTILRTAYAFDYDAVILTNHGANPYQDKVLRAGMGASFHIPIYQLDDSSSLIKRLKEEDINSLAMALNGQELKEYKVDERIALWIGNEGNGLQEKIIDEAEVKITIPMPGGAESLNAAVAAAIALYEIKK